MADNLEDCIALWGEGKGNDDNDNKDNSKDDLDAPSCKVQCRYLVCRIQ
jgi:hypothetical protein